MMFRYLFDPPNVQTKARSRKRQGRNKDNCDRTHKAREQTKTEKVESDEGKLG